MAVEAQVEAQPLTSGLMDPDELAHELRVTKRTLARWSALRTGPPKTIIGRKVYYKRESVERWIAEQEQQKPKRNGRRR